MCLALLLFSFKAIIAIVVMVSAVDVCVVVSIVVVGLVVVGCVAADVCFSSTVIVSPARPIYSTSLVYLMHKHVALKPVLLC